VKRIARNDDTKAKELIACIAALIPGITNTDVWLIMNAEHTRALTLNNGGTQSGSRQGCPIIQYLLHLAISVHKGQMKSYHTLDIPISRSTTWRSRLP
jgi:hypothetical protein